MGHFGHRCPFQQNSKIQKLFLFNLTRYSRDPSVYQYDSYVVPEEEFDITTSSTKKYEALTQRYMRKEPEQEAAMLIDAEQWETAQLKKAGVVAAPTIPSKRSRWDESPVSVPDLKPHSHQPTATPMYPETKIVCPVSANLPVDKAISDRWNLEIDTRDRQWTDQELNSMLPNEGYQVLLAPSGIIPILSMTTSPPSLKRKSLWPSRNPYVHHLHLPFIPGDLAEPPRVPCLKFCDFRFFGENVSLPLFFSTFFLV